MVRLSFRRGGEKEFYKLLKRALADRAWAGGEVSSKSSRPCFSFSTSFVRELTCFMLLFAASFDSEYFECNERRKSLGERKINACGREAWS